MAITLQLLEWLLRKDYKVTRLPRYSPYLSFTDTFFWDGKKAEPNVLYFKSHTVKVPNMAPDEYPNFHIIEEELMPEFHSQCGMYVTCPGGEVATTINRICHLIGEYNRWYYDTLYVGAKAFHPQSFVDIWDSCFDLPISILDTSYTVVAQSNNITRLFPGSHPLPVGTRFDIKRIQYLMDMGLDYDMTFSEKGLRRYTVTGNETRHTYYYNLFVHKQFAARMLISVPLEDDIPGVELLLAECGDLMTDNYIRYIESKYVFENKNSLTENLTKLLNGENVDAGEMSTAAKELDWQLEHTYRAIYVTIDRSVRSAIGLGYFCEAAERAIPCSIALDRKDHVLIVVNESLYPSTMDRTSTLESFLRESQTRAGISTPYVGIFKTTAYYYQAEEASRLGMKRAPEERIHRFVELTLEYALSEITKQVPGSDQCCPIMQTLREYDRLHVGSELDKTLYTFLKLNGNATAAAEELYIHRTTFLYRMSKIHQLVGEIDLNDWDTKLRLMLSYSLNPTDVKEGAVSEKVIF